MNNKLSDQIYNEIMDITSFLIEIGLAIDQNFPSNKALIKKQHEVTISRLDLGASFIIQSNEYVDIYNHYNDNRLYNVKMLDGGILLLQYVVYDEIIISHRLVFFPSPYLPDFAREYDSSYREDQYFQDIYSRVKVAFPLRFDFSPDQHVDIHHPKSHLTLGDFKCCRIPVVSSIYPRSFFKFVLDNFYKTDDIEHSSRLPNSKICSRQEESITATERQELMYMCFP